MDPKRLTELKPEKDFFIGIDSDGCVFDTMEIKHKECFCPNYIKFFRLQPVAKYAREIWEFVNLYSKNRGCNRFIALLESFRLLNERREVKNRNFSTMDGTPLKEWIKKENKLGNPALKKYAAEVNDPFISLVLEWSEAVNESIEDMVFGIAPFPNVINCLKMISSQADSIVVSQTPLEALEREWKENHIDGYVNFIAGQEYGTKSEHIKYAAAGKYEPDKILMVGDAEGDLKAARSNNALFFPINPGFEEVSWEKLFTEGLERFFNGTFKGDYQEKLLREFDRYLPEKPSWN